MEQKTRFGGLSCPKSVLYYHAALLDVMKWWFTSDDVAWCIEQLKLQYH